LDLVLLVTRPIERFFFCAGGSYPFVADVRDEKSLLNEEALEHRPNPPDLDRPHRRTIRKISIVKCIRNGRGRVAL